VDADGAAAIGAAPSLFFAGGKGIQADAFDALQILYHAHCVLCPVSLVQLLQPPTGILFALVAEAGLVFLYSFAVTDSTPQAGGCFIAILNTASGAFILLSEISQADTAVHTTGSNQFHIHHANPAVTLYPIGILPSKPGINKNADLPARVLIRQASQIIALFLPPPEPGSRKPTGG
jgi:hypothetical protein